MESCWWNSITHCGKRFPLKLHSVYGSLWNYVVWKQNRLLLPQKIKNSCLKPFIRNLKAHTHLTVCSSGDFSFVSHLQLEWPVESKFSQSFSCISCNTYYNIEKTGLLRLPNMFSIKKRNNFSSKATFYLQKFNGKSIMNLSNKQIILIEKRKHWINIIWSNNV